jgi:hypothetical protein
MMIGSGMPISHNSKPRPNPIASSVWIAGTTADEGQRFLR